jgi:ligand-binding sensor domain-containing protein
MSRASIPRALMRMARVKQHAGIVVAALLSGLAASRLFAQPQPQEPLVDFWQESAGLPQNHVYAVYQTRDGYLWVGTRGGLARFDGVRFTRYNDSAGQLPAVEVGALAEGPDGSLWIGTWGGGLARLKDGTFTTFGLREGLPNEWVQALEIGSDGSLWVGTRQGLAHMEDGRFRVFTEKEGLPSLNVRDIHRDGDVVWIATERGLASFESGRLVNQALVHPGALDRRFEQIEGSRGKEGLWLATWGHGLMQWRGDTLATLGSERGLPTPNIAAISLDASGRLWLCTADGLFYYADGRFQTFSGEQHTVGRNRVLSNVSLHTARTLFLDREGSLWIGTKVDGLARLRDPLFTSVSVAEGGGGSERANSVFEDSRGALWVGMANGVVKRLQGGVSTAYQTSSKNTIDTVVEDSDGTIWAASLPGLYRFDSKRFVSVPAPSYIQRINTILADPAGGLWLGGMTGGGLTYYRDGEFRHYTAEDGLTGVAMRSIARSPAGELWVTTNDAGAAVLRNGRFQTYSLKEGLPSPRAVAVYVDAKNVAWVATQKGLSRIEGDRITTFTTQHGLPENYIYQIVEDDDGFLWMTYGRGVVRVERAALDAAAAGKVQTLNVRTFGTESGLRSTGMTSPNQPTVWKARDGRIWFATWRGLAAVDPRALGRKPAPPPVHIESIQVDGRGTGAGPGATFPPGEGAIEIQYTSLSLLSPERARFRYRLEGVDRDWVDAGARRTAFYTKLPPGPYRFEVTASNEDGVWNERSDTLAFHLRPHWYQTAAFRAATVLLFALGLAGAHRWRVRAHKRREKELAHRVEEALGQIKTLRGLLPVCAQCKKIRDDKGAWNQMEMYIQEHSEAGFSHGICPDCMSQLYPDYVRATSPAK